MKKEELFHLWLNHKITVLEYYLLLIKNNRKEKMNKILKSKKIIIDNV